MTEAQEQASRIAELQSGMAKATTGHVIGIDWGTGLVTVNLGGYIQSMPWKSAPPWVGDRVGVETVGGLPRCTLIEGSPYGTVQSVDGDYVNVTGDDGETYKYVFVGGTTFTSGQRVALDHARKFVLGKLSTDPVFDPKPSPPPPPPVKPSGGAAWFNPIWSGNWRPGFAGDVAEISTSRMAMYGYGTQIADTVPDGSGIRRAELHLVKNWESSSTTTVPTSMGTHAFNGRPGTADNSVLGGDYQFGPNVTVVDIRGEVADRLKLAYAFGVGFRSGSNGWRQYAAAPISGRIYMEW